jgi:hypothetical protein
MRSNCATRPIQLFDRILPSDAQSRGKYYYSINELGAIARPAPIQLFDRVLPSDT